MKLTNKHFRIAEIMAAFFTGSQTEQDERDFEEWTKESDRHRAFVDRLLNPEEYEENRRALDKFQVEEAWSKMDKKIGDTKVRKLPSWKMGCESMQRLCLSSCLPGYIIGGIVKR